MHHLSLEQTRFHLIPHTKTVKTIRENSTIAAKFILDDEELWVHVIQVISNLLTKLFKFLIFE